jgi:hypothetical protein
MNAKGRLTVTAFALAMAALAAPALAATTDARAGSSASAAAMVGGGAATATTPPAGGAADAHDHAHEHDGEAPTLTLDGGKKWATDAALRQGMTRIRSVVEPRLPDIHQGRVGAAQYAQMANDIGTQVGYIVGNCKLDPKADAVLHAILAEVVQGMETMAGKDKSVRPERGVVQVIGGLNQYGDYFQHAGWKPVKTGH